MRVKEYRKALKRGTIDGKLVVEVWNHKTVVSHSSADIVLEPELQGLVVDYVTYLRPDTASKHLLVRSDGQPLLSKNISRELKQLGRELEIELPSITTVRKMTSSKARTKLAPVQVQQVAHAMSHSSATAARYYQNVGTSAPETYSLIQSVQISPQKPGRRACILLDSSSESDKPVEKHHAETSVISSDSADEKPVRLVVKHADTDIIHHIIRGFRRL